MGFGTISAVCLDPQYWPRIDRDCECVPGVGVMMRLACKHANILTHARTVARPTCFPKALPPTVKGHGKPIQLTLLVLDLGLDLLHGVRRFGLKGDATLASQDLDENLHLGTGKRARIMRSKKIRQNEVQARSVEVTVHTKEEIEVPSSQ